MDAAHTGLIFAWNDRNGTKIRQKEFVRLRQRWGIGQQTERGHMLDLAQTGLSFAREPQESDNNQTARFRPT